MLASVLEQAWREADWKAVAKKGGEVVIYPKRGRTIIAFTPTQTK